MSRVKLRSGDGRVFEVDEAVANMSGTIKGRLEDGGVREVLLPDVDGRTLAKVIEFCTFHVEASKTDADGKPAKSQDEIKAWEAEFFNVTRPVLFDFILAANYLDCPAMLQAGGDRVASIIKGKTPEEIRQHFGIKNDFTPEEEIKIRREAEWSFDD